VKRLQVLSGLEGCLSVGEPELGDRQPPRLERVDVCSASGDLPNAECPQTVSTWYIPGTSPIRISQVHRRVYIDTRTSEQACPPYDPKFTRSEVFEFWPTDLLQLFTQAGMPRRRFPVVFFATTRWLISRTMRTIIRISAISSLLLNVALSDIAAGDAAAIDAYLGKGHTFHAAMARFASAYALQNQHDHTQLVEAIRDREIDSAPGW
jgi:hypothetical protein